MKNLLSTLLIIVLSIVMLSCPEPISQEVLNQAEDTHSPRITVSSPSNNDIYYSETTITGTVLDDAIESGDTQGVIDSFSFEILYDADRRGGIVREGASYVQDTDVGTGVIAYTPATGAFEFTISTISPSVLSGQITLRITATDSNGNVTISDLKLLDSSGPVISITEPGTTITEFDTGDDIVISGTVKNSNQDSGADQISNISWNANNAITGDLSLDGSDGTFSTTTSPQGLSFSYNTSTNQFSSILRVSDTTTGFYVITIEAEDFNGHITTVSRTIYRSGAGPDFDFSGSTNTTSSTTYLRKDAYSPYSIELTFDDYTEVTSLTYQGKSNAGDAALAEISLSLPTSNTYSFTPNASSYYTNIQSWLASTQILQLYVTAANADGEESVHLLNMMLDSLGPTVSINSISGTTDYNGNTYAGSGEKAIDFSYNDSYSGVGDIILSISGETVPDQNPPDDTYNHTFTSGTDGGTVTFSLSAEDVAGNISSTAQNVIFYYTNPTVSWSSMTSGGDLFAASGDSIDLTFSSNHTLPSLPTVQIGGISATVTRIGDSSFTASTSLSSGSVIDPVGITISGVTDAAGLSMSSTFTDSSSLTYDPVAPTVDSVTANYAEGSSLKKNNKLSLTATASDTGSSVAYVEFDFSEIGGGTLTDSSSVGGWTSGDYTIPDGLTVSGADVLITAYDSAGNPSSGYEFGSYNIDNTPPTVTASNITLVNSSGTVFASGTVFTDGDTIYGQWDASAASGDDESDVDTVTIDMSDFGGSSTASATETSVGSQKWRTAAVTIDTADNSVTSGLTISVTAVDAATNSSGAITGSGSYSSDNEAPAPTGANITLVNSSDAEFPSGTVFTDGDTIYGQWDASASGDNESDVDTVTIDMSGFGGSSTASATETSAGSQIWQTAAVTVNTADSAVTSGLTISVTALDAVANSSSTVTGSGTYSSDNEAPAPTAANIDLVNISGTVYSSGTVFKDGDTIYAQWDATTSTGDDWADIASVTFNMTGFGGTSSVSASETSAGSRIWRTAGISIDTTDDTVTSPISISVTAEDDVANSSGTVSDTDTYSVDNELPTIAGGSVNGTDTSIIVNFSETAYSAAEGSGDLVAADFDISISGTGATDASITSVSHTAGDSTATLTLSYTGTPTADNDIIITPADGASVYDQAGNPMDAAQTTGTIDLTGS